MKNKIFKALGVGAVATLGLFTLAGCSFGGNNANIIKGLENANTHLEKTVDLLKEQNKLLKDQNKLLEDYILENKGTIISSEEAWNKLTSSVTNWEINYNGVRDNVKITMSASQGNYTSVYEGLKTEGNGYVVLNSNENNESTQLAYEHNNNVFVYEKDTNSYTKEQVSGHLTSESVSGISNFFTMCFNLEKMTYNDVTNVEVLNNGNCKISFTYEGGNFTVGMDIYGKIVSVDIMNGAVSTQIEIEYNVVDENVINQILAEAISKALKSK